LKWGKDRLDKIKVGRDRAAAERQRLVERLKARPASALKVQIAPPLLRPAEPRRCAGLDVEMAMSAASRLRLMRLNPSLDVQVGGPESLNRPTLMLLRSFLTAVASGGSAAVLQWPFGQRDVAALHPLAMLAALCSPPARTANGNAWCEGVADFRTLYFPWRGGGTGAAQRSILVDRRQLLARNSRHLMRRHVGVSEVSEQLARLHETYGHMTRLSLRDASKPHLAHPTLAELYPAFADDGENARVFRSPVGELLGRVRYGAALDQLRDYRPEICHPILAPFALYGVSARSDLKKVLGHAAFTRETGGRGPDICLLDLGPPSLTRLGHGWEDVLERFLTETLARFPDLPVLAVTHDPYVHRRAAKLIEGGRPIRERPASSVLIRATDDLMTTDPVISGFSRTSVQVHSAGGPAAEALSALAEAARSASDPVIAGMLRRGIGQLRRALALPCGLAAAYDLLSEAEGQDAATAFLERRAAGTILAVIQRAIDSGVSGAERSRFTEAEAAVRRAFASLDDDTPVGSLLRDLIRSMTRKSSRTVFAFGSPAELNLAERRFTADAELGEALWRRLQSNHVKLASVEALDAELSGIEASRDKNSWKRLILVAPTNDGLPEVLMRPWLPDELIIVCDQAFARRTAGSLRILAGHPDLNVDGGPGARLNSVAAAAQKEADARSVSAVDLELEAKPIVLATDNIIDLIDDDDDGREIVVFKLQSGRSLRTRPGSVIVRHHRDAEINPFERATAREVVEGETIVIPDRGFIEEARRVLPIKVLAASRVLVYHTAVEATLPQLAGETLPAKARTLMQRMRPLGAREVSQAAVIDWLKVTEHKALPPDQLRPHAPQRRREFNAMMRALGLEALADKVWVEGIEQLRNDRRRAGLRMAQAFVSVLVDPHGAAAGLDRAIRDNIVALRTSALDHLDVVVLHETYDTQEGQVA
jgi:hypothetical protein